MRLPFYVAVSYFVLLFGLSFAQETSFGPTPTFLELVGFLHPILVHFPIALIMFAVLAEVLHWIFKVSIFSNAAEFMIVAAAVAVIPTVMTGLVFAYVQNFTGVMETFLYWHAGFGLTTAFLTIFAAIVREWPSMRANKSLNLYYVLLTLDFFSVSITGFLGGEMTYSFPFVKTFISISNML